MGSGLQIDFWQKTASLGYKPKKDSDLNSCVKLTATFVPINSR